MSNLSEFSAKNGKMNKFEMKYVGGCRGEFFNGEEKWKDEDLLRGLMRVRLLGAEEEEVGWGGINEDRDKMKSLEDVKKWLESDCIGSGEEVYVEIKVNGKKVYEDKVGLWMWKNGEEWEDYENELEERGCKECGVNVEEYMCGDSKFWKI